MSKRKKQSGLPFVQLHYWVINSPAFRDLSPEAKVTYIALKAKYNGRNNGFLAFGARAAGDALGMSRPTGNRALLELEAHGFIARQIEATFHSKRMSIEWILTEVKNDATGALPTKGFMRWRPASEESGPGRPVKKSTSDRVDSRGTKLQASPRGHGPARDAILPNEKKPVSNAEHTVSEARHERLIATPRKTDSLNGGTAPAHVQVPQSHGRDTYTSAPSGAEVRYPDRLALLALVRSRIAGTVEDQEILDRITPVADGVVDHLLRHHFGDPLVRAVLETFPGSRPQLTKADVDKSVRRYVADRQHRVRR